MKSVLVFAAGKESTRQILAPYRLPAFLKSLAEEGVDAFVVDVNRREGASSPTSSLLGSDPPRVVHTFGDAALLSTIWRDAARMGCLLAHSVTDDPSIRRALLPAHLWTKHASRHVQAVLGSNRARLRDYIEAGFFPHARFSMIALPPVEIPMEPRKAVHLVAGSLPTFGYCKHDAADDAWEFLLAAVKLTGAQHLFRLLIGGQRSGSTSRQLANISFEHFRATSDFVAAVDALIVPKSDDRTLEQVVLALRDSKAVIAPDDGAIAEVLGFGRHGVLFSAGNPYDLARSINNLTASWKRQPFDFKGGGSIINRTTPKEVARTFARAYRRLDELNQPMNKAVAS